VENIEGQWALAGKGLQALSPEFLVDCDPLDCGCVPPPRAATPPLTSRVPSLYRVFGGWPYRAYQTIQKLGGVPSEAAYPYCLGAGDCYPCMAKGWNETFCGPGPTYCNQTYNNDMCDSAKAVAHISSWDAIAANETAMAQELVARGPLSILMDATGLQWYKGGVWNPTGFLACTSDPADLDHAVLLVGYGRDAASGLDFWLVKNSWGADWGEEGYFKLARGVNRCCVNCQVTSATV